MARYAVKRPTDKPGVWEWYSIKDENSSYVEIRLYDFRKDAEEAAASWAPGKAEIVEINR